MNETIVPKLNMVLPQMGPDRMFDGAFDEATSNYNGLGKSDFVVGSEENIFNWKRILLRRAVSVLWMQVLGADGKTLMAMVLCNDQEIEGGAFLPVALIWAIFVTYHSFCNIYKRFNSSDEEDEAGSDIFSVPTKKTPLDSLRKKEAHSWSFWRLES